MSGKFGQKVSRCWNNYPISITLPRPFNFPTRAKSAPYSRMARPRSRTTPAHSVRRRPPFFHPVPLRARRDGWTVARQCHFLAQLYVTGSVTAAARSVGMSRASAYRLRERAGAEGFGWAWDHVLMPPQSGRHPRRKADLRKVTNPVLLWWLETGLVQPVIYQHRVVAVRSKPCNTSLFALLRRGDAAGIGLGRRGADGNG